jgi:DNA-directed RNA polymerase specialized sigma54-like protein
VTGDEGDDIASTAIKAAIKQLVAREDVRKPLSDAKLCALLKERGYASRSQNDRKVSRTACNPSLK